MRLLGWPVSLGDGGCVVGGLAQALGDVGFMLPGALAAQEAPISVPWRWSSTPAPALAAALVRRTRKITSPAQAWWLRTDPRKQEGGTWPPEDSHDGSAPRLGRA